MTLRYQEPSRASLALMLEQCEGFVQRFKNKIYDFQEL